MQARIDGSSTFPKGSQYGFFPSVSAGWMISKESWFNQVSFVNNLKIRASYGVLGNDNVGQFQYFSNYSPANNYVAGSGSGTSIIPEIDLTKLANPNITWEEAKKMDIGIEAVLFNDFSLEFIYFKQNRSKILAPRNVSIPPVSGIVNPFGGSLVPDENIGRVNNNGIEATLGYNKRKGKFHYGVSSNITYAKSKIIFIDEALGVLSYQKRTGHQLSSYLLYNAIGIFRTTDDIAKYPHLNDAKPGDLIYEDYNNDGKISADDQGKNRLWKYPVDNIRRSFQFRL